MKKFLMGISIVAGLSSAALCSAQAIVGNPAPAFSAFDAAGKKVSLADYKGKFVVLEWMNPDCPFTQAHYVTGNMPSTQKHAAEKGAIWLSINTANQAQAGAALSAWMKSQQGTPSAIVPDDGKIARAYGAKTTPHMFLIDPSGKLVYAGAIDSMTGTNPADIKSATNYVKQALDETATGKPISRAVTKPYGCAVKYSPSA